MAGPLPWWEVAGYGRDALAVLRALHAAGLYVPGLGPASLFMRQPGTGPGSVALAGFSGPGQQADSTADQASADLWSLGMVLYVLAEGHEPSHAGTQARTDAGATATGDLAPPPVRSGPLADVLRAVLAPDPATRPDAARLDAMLAAVQAQAPPAYPPPPPSGPPGTNAPRRSHASTALITVLALTAVAALGTGAAVLLAGDGDDSPAAAGSPSATPTPSAADGDGQGDDRAGTRVPEHASGTDGLTIRLGDPDAPHTLVVYEDLRCPYCASFEEQMGGEVHSDVQEGTYNVEYVFGTFLDGNLGGSGSMNALIALGAALDVSPDAFRLYHQSLFAAQPPEYSDDFANDERLLEIGRLIPELQNDEQFEQDVTGDTFQGWATAMSQAFLDNLDVTGTPTLRFDGQIIPTPQSAAEFRQAIDDLTTP
ncbi:thioredoxin domain-containing protein [Streptomyces litchfieldiae]|uniref:Thioredoxin domain-containing protein n=1 Tax=Streptomyces litchfieldiae TaxID=3075543 RepID=A0ABU2MS73_9ACTN|nr:thioredoxin domain-containing protein [Streptomyces sp. DSM 44938]MDT0344477.1 thioredoxin domain-containing protein [Streptomyces sp. DSM 44938]